MKEVTVHFFATLKDRVGTGETKITLPEDARVSDLKIYLEENFPNLQASLETALISVNREYAFDEDTIPEGAEIAIFPPVSGGASEQPTYLIITEDEIRLNKLLEQITLPTTGAACFFTGMVRGITLGDDAHKTTSLEYEAYQPMAELKLDQVANEIRSRWPDVEGIAIAQRVGHLESGTLTIAIGCSSPHRNSSIFDAARYGIDRLKQIVPIWKKEIGPNGESWVEGNYTPKKSDQSGLNQ